MMMRCGRLSRAYRRWLGWLGWWSVLDTRDEVEGDGVDVGAHGPNDQRGVESVDTVVSRVVHKVPFVAVVPQHVHRSAHLHNRNVGDGGVGVGRQVVLEVGNGHVQRLLIGGDRQTDEGGIRYLEVELEGLHATTSCDLTPPYTHSCMDVM